VCNASKIFTSAAIWTQLTIVITHQEQGGHVIKTHYHSHCTQWFQPPHWAAISEAMVWNKWKVSKAIQSLWKSPGGAQFNTLHPGTVVRWMEKCTPKDHDHGHGQWTKKTLKAVEKVHQGILEHNSNMGHPRFLVIRLSFYMEVLISCLFQSKHPAIVKVICE
jgi:hypothetical protein